MIDPNVLADVRAALNTVISEEAERDVQQRISLSKSVVSWDMLGWLREHNRGLYLDAEEVARCSGKTVAWDTETTGLTFWNCHVIGIAFWCPQADVYGYLPTPDERSRQRIRELMLAWSPETVSIGHNIKFDCHFMDLDPISWDVRIIDTTILAHLMDSRDRKALDNVARKYLGQSTKAEYVAWARKEGGKGRRKLMIWEWPLDVVAEYAIGDTRLTYEIAKKLIPEIKTRGMWPLLTQLMRYLGRIWQIERYGMILDQVFVENAIRALGNNVQVIEEDLFEACGQRFNWRSSAQLSRALYDNLGVAKPTPELDGLKKDTKFKVRYTDTATSSYLLMEKAHHSLGPTVLDLREADKLRKYLELWRGLADSNSAIHTNFNISGTRTGRLSSSKPNIQNLPGLERTRETQSSYSGKSGYTREKFYNLRQAFVPRPGNVFAAIDYRQQEIRCFGIQSGDENMIEALRSGQDIHGSIAQKIWKFAPDDPKAKTYREWAKTVSFGLLYGMTSGSLQFRLNMTREQAFNVAEKYWETFPRIRPWLFEVIDECKRNGYVTYWSGRRWYEDNPELMYKAANALVQGGSHDLIMTAICRVADFLGKKYPEVKIFSTVHDEIDLELPPEMLDEVIPQVQEIAEVPDIFDLPFFTDVKVGENYGVMKNWEPTRRQ